MAASTLDEVDVYLRDVISNLYTLIVQAYDYQGQTTQKAMQSEMYSISIHFRLVHH